MNRMQFQRESQTILVCMCSHRKRIMMILPQTLVLCLLDWEKARFHSGGNSNCELVIKSDLRVQEPKGGEVIRVLLRPSVLADLSFEEIKGTFEQLPEAVSLFALARTADGTRARYSRLYRTLASKVPALKEIVAEMERGGVFKDVRS
jgi:hypothetical protein